MDSVRRFCVLLFALEMSWCSVVDRSMRDKIDKNTTLYIVTPSPEFSTTPEQHYFTTWTWNRTQIQSGTNIAQSFSSHFITRFDNSPKISVGLSAQTTARTRSFKQTASKNEKASPTRTIGQTSSLNGWLNTVIPRNATRHASKSKQKKIISTYLWKPNSIQSSRVVVASSQFGHFSNYNIRSSPPQTVRTLMGSNGATGAKHSKSSDSRSTHLIRISSFNPGRSEEPEQYQTSSFNIVISTTQLHKSAQITTEPIDSSPSFSITFPGSTNTGRNISGYTQTTLSESPIFTSQIFKSSQQIKTTTVSRHGGSILAAKNTPSSSLSSMFTNLRANTALQPTFTPTTSPNIFQTTLRTAHITSAIYSRVGVTISRLTTKSSSVTDKPGKSTVLMSKHLWTSRKLPEHSATPEKGADSSTQITKPSNIKKYFTDEQLKSTVTPTSTGTDTVGHSTSFTESTNLPFYLLAICLPIAFLLGFVMAVVYFRRSRQDHATQYSVTVEIAEKTDYEMKRMYSIIDINAGNINKDFWTGLKNTENSRSSILDLTSTKPTT